jgi:hypothetical protein
MKGIIIVLIALSMITYSCSSKKQITNTNKNFESIKTIENINNFVDEIDKFFPKTEITNSKKVKLTNEVLKCITDEEAFYKKGEILKIIVQDLFVNNYKRNLIFYYKDNEVIFIKSIQESLLKKDDEITIRKIYYQNGIVIFDSSQEDKLDNELLFLAENSLKEEYKNL